MPEISNLMDARFRESNALRYDPRSQRFEPVPFRELSWAINDIGTLYGAILVERFRTYGRKMFDLEDRSNRLFAAAQILRIETQSIESEFELRLQHLLAINQELLEEQEDVSIVILLSPGQVISGESSFDLSPTCMIYLSPLPFKRLAEWYSYGTSLKLSKQCSVPNACWPTQMKSRSRLPYLLANQSISESFPESLPLLMTTRNTIADTSVANILIVDSSGGIVSPPTEDALQGCSLQLARRLLERSGMTVTFRDLYPRDLTAAREIILTGSSGGVWFANSVDGQSVSGQKKGPIASILGEQWMKHVGMDYEHQAFRLGARL